MATRWTDEEGERLTELHAEGKSLHFIAMSLAVEGVGVDAREAAHLSFDRTRTAKAAEAVHVDNKARRAAWRSGYSPRLTRCSIRCGLRRWCTASAVCGE